MSSSSAVLQPGAIGLAGRPHVRVVRTFRSAYSLYLGWDQPASAGDRTCRAIKKRPPFLGAATRYKVQNVSLPWN